MFPLALTIMLALWSLTPGSKALDADCNQEEGQCQIWKQEGMCKKNPYFMVDRCRDCCNFCLVKPQPACHDKFDKDQCRKWKRLGKCSLMVDVSQQLCNKTCNFCQEEIKTCPPGYIKMEDYCLKTTVIENVIWRQAKENCRKMGGNLASVKDDKANKQIILAIKESGFKKPIWFGLNDIDNEGVYRYTDGTPYFFKYWAANQPESTSSKNCAAYSATADNKWQMHNCERRFPYICIRRHGSLCSKKCHENANCVNVDNRNFKCQCKKGFIGDGVKHCSKPCKCKVGFGSRFRTYDSMNINFYGLCTYLLTKSTTDAPECQFEVRIRKSGDAKHNFIHAIVVIWHKNVVELLRDGEVRLNEVRRNLPVYDFGGDALVNKQGRYVVFYSKTCNIKVSFDGSASAYVRVASERFGNKLVGICGNCNNDASDDYSTKDGEDVNDNPRRFELIGNSFRIIDSKHDKKRCSIDIIPECKRAQILVAGSQLYCGRIKNYPNAFKKCFEKDATKQEKFFRSCRLDVCKIIDNPEKARKRVCSHLSILAEECAQINVLVDWRTRYNCPLKCGKNQVFSHQALACQRSCTSLFNYNIINCPLKRREGCVCRPGFLLSGTKCVPKSECGCTDRNNARPLGSSWINSDCSRQFKCVGPEKIESKPYKCIKNSTCKNINGEFGCYCHNRLLKPADKKCPKVEKCSAKPAPFNQICEEKDDDCVCKCIDNYEMVNNVCKKKNVCKIYAKTCGLNSICVPNGNSYKCECKKGFTDNGKRCIHYCHTRPNVCKKNETCKPFGFSHKCLCKSGLIRNKSNKMCVCPYNFVLRNGECQRIPPCERKPSVCKRNHVCEHSSNQQGYNCRCKWPMDNPDEKCEPNKLCKCHENAKCIKTVNSNKTQCKCHKGYQGDGKLICKDINECLKSKICKKNEKCINTPGSYYCKAICTDKICGKMARCEVSNNSVVCKCRGGSVMNSDKQCRCLNNFKWNGKHCEKKITPCEEFSWKCKKNEKCLNVGTQYKCVCKKDYERINKICECKKNTKEVDGQCKPIKPCDLKPNRCGKYAICVNTFKSFKCICISGFVMADKKCVCRKNHVLKNDKCVRIRPCDLVKGVCGKYGRCINSGDSYVCICLKKGFVVADNKCICPKDRKIIAENCVKISICKEKPQICGSNSTCIDSGSSYICSCKLTFVKIDEKCVCQKGFKLVNNKCVKIICSGNPNLCPKNAECINTQKGYKCICLKGYVMENKKCRKLVVCSNKKKRCHENAECYDRKFPLNRICKCKPGFVGNGETKCEDIDECENNSHNCHKVFNSECFNTYGSFTCQCKKGYTKLGTKCVREPVCNKKPSVCPKNSVCEDRPKGHKCICIKGFVMKDDECVCLPPKKVVNNRCVRVNICDKRPKVCPNNSICVETRQSYRCVCINGFSMIGKSCVCDKQSKKIINSKCENIPICKSRPNLCDWKSRCVQSGKSYVCICRKQFIEKDKKCVCPKNTELVGRKCQKVDPCSEPNKKCGPNSKCIVTGDSYKCECIDGFVEIKNKCLCPRNTIIKNGICVQIKPCDRVPGPCSKNEDCFNNVWTFVCKCKPGYIRKNSRCIKIKTCKNLKCHKFAECIENAPPKLSKCKCSKGFMGDGKIECKDINECKEESHKCKYNQKCINTIGSYYCVDIDVCKTSPYICGLNAKCVSVGSSYECICNKGFIKDGKQCFCPRGLMEKNNKCVRPNICKEDPSICGKNSICVLTKTSYKCICLKSFIQTKYGCECKKGFRKIGNECIKPNPCKPNKCGDNSSCKELPNSFKCICNPGFIKVNGKCIPDKKCRKCHKFAQCDNEDKKCKCRLGFRGDGKILCTDINECKEEKFICPAFSFCENTIGSYKCKCDKNFVKIRGQCIKIEICKKNPKICGNNAICIETEKSYTCKCKKNFEKNLNNECVPAFCKACDNNTHNCHKHAKCLSRRGRCICICKKPYIGDGFNCKKPNCCLTTKNKCVFPAKCKCINDKANCVCPNKGYEKDGEFRCVPINHCRRNLHDCDVNADCVPTKHSYYCRCKKFFRGNGKKCEKIPVCPTSANKCSIHANCKETKTSYKCTCNNGFEGDGFQCRDVNECKKNIHDCHPNAECINTIGSYKCRCKTGFEGSGKKCHDIDECARQTDNCASRKIARCINTIGSFDCRCRSKFIGDGFTCSCKDPKDKLIKSECTKPVQCHRNARKVNTLQGFKCQCKLGFTGDGKRCTDVNECKKKTDKCDRPKAFCVNTVGSYKCFCKDGFRGNGFVCNEINNCLLGKNKCSPNANCKNTKNGYTCVCRRGYQGDGYTCTDINECLVDKLNKCSKHARCINAPGSYICECKTGFQGNGFICKDINECELGTHHCSRFARCLNTIGSYRCECRPGYTGDGKTCRKIKKCPKCHKYAYCLKNDSNPICVCQKGFSGNGIECEDINECKTNKHKCHPKAKCTNILGSYKCQCIQGYIGDGRKKCDPKPTCESNKCSKRADCIEKEDSYICKCKVGYRGNGFVCRDINECKENSHNCHPKAICTNTPGSYSCNCKSGFKGDGKICHDINECEKPDNKCCNKVVGCINTYGSYKCICGPGYTGNGWLCKDIDECQLGTHECDQFNGLCLNTVGSYNCVCRNGYHGNGRKCRKLTPEELQAISDQASSP